METGQTIISGMGELQLDISRAACFREFNVQAGCRQTAVAYRETITKAAMAKGKVYRQSGGTRAVRSLRYQDRAGERVAGSVV